MRMQRNFYEVLGVQKNSSQAEIKAKYLNLARQYHPDRAQDKQVADRLFVQINQAYSTLRNPVKRAQYDATLIATSQSATRPPAQSAATNNYTPPAPQQQQVTGQVMREWFEQAGRLQLQGNAAQALEYCNRVLAADPTNMAALVLSGDLLAQIGKDDEAIEAYERASKVQPTNRLVREKISRLNAAKARRAMMPGNAARPAATNITPPSAPPPPVQRPIPAAAPAAPRSFLDKLIGKK